MLIPQKSLREIQSNWFYSLLIEKVWSYWSSFFFVNIDIVELQNFALLPALCILLTQAYLHCPSTATMGATCTMHQAMGALAGWMSSNWLRLNTQTTKFIWLGARQQLAKLNLNTLSAEFRTMSFSPVVCDLGGPLRLRADLQSSNRPDVQ